MGKTNLLAAISLSLFCTYCPLFGDKNDGSKKSNPKEETSVSAVEFTPGSGTYGEAQSVTFTSDEGSSIYYTTDGSPPSTGSNLYEAPVTIDTYTEIQAIAIKDGSESDISAAEYTFEFAVLPTPEITPAGATFNEPAEVTITSSDTEASIFYTIDGTQPSAASQAYTAPFEVTSTATVKAIAIRLDYANSEVAEASYIIDYTVAVPSVTVAAGEYTSAVNVELSTTTPGAEIYYTTDDGLDDDEIEGFGSLYSGAVNIDTYSTLRAIAVRDGYTDSMVSSNLYTFDYGQAGTPSNSLAAGSYSSSRSVTLSSGIAGSTIRYTTNTTQPTATCGNIYSGSFDVDVSTDVNAIVTHPDYSPSTVLSRSYTIGTNDTTDPQVIAYPSGGAYGSTIDVGLYISEPGSVYYTTDGSTPTQASSEYTSVLTFTSTTALKVLAVDSAGNEAAVKTYNYTIDGSSPDVAFQQPATQPVVRQNDWGSALWTIDSDAGLTNWRFEVSTIVVPGVGSLVQEGSVFPTSSASGLPLNYAFSNTIRPYILFLRNGTTVVSHAKLEIYFAWDTTKSATATAPGGVYCTNSAYNTKIVLDDHDEAVWRGEVIQYTTDGRSPSLNSTLPDLDGNGISDHCEAGNLPGYGEKCVWLGSQTGDIPIEPYLPAGCTPGVDCDTTVELKYRVYSSYIGRLSSTQTETYEFGE